MAVLPFTIQESLDGNKKQSCLSWLLNVLSMGMTYAQKLMLLMSWALS